MKILKYIITDKKIPIIFSRDITHNEILLSGISAGFLILRYNFIDNQFSVKCYGESTSLNLKMDREDQSIIRHYLNNQFFNSSNSLADTEMSENDDFA
ncbi:MAG: hypothetical protein PHW29_10620 [Flavobacterium sp.]|jgi:hypothetical protein|nr:hypothetical protein [uncultured Flavobacterium sp.]MDD2821704.1 hypothetical protein [Flavobacterium sp.]